MVMSFVSLFPFGVERKNRFVNAFKVSLVYKQSNSNTYNRLGSRHRLNGLYRFAKIILINKLIVLVDKKRIAVGTFALFNDAVEDCFI